VGALLRPVDSINRLFVGRIGSQPVNGIGGESNDPSALDGLNSKLDLFFDTESI
jgi:hypothetical protein